MRTRRERPKKESSKLGKTKGKRRRSKDNDACEWVRVCLICFGSLVCGFARPFPSFPLLSANDDDDDKAILRVLQRQKSEDEEGGKHVPFSAPCSFPPSRRLVPSNEPKTRFSP